MPQRMIWYWPVAGATEVRVDLGYSMQVLTPMPQRDRVTTLDGLRRPYHLDLGGGLRVKVRKERMTAGAGLVAQLRAVENALQRGLTIGIAADRAKALVTWARTPIRAGDTTLDVSANYYNSILPDALNIVAGDVLVIESGNPEFKREEVIVSSITAGTGYTIVLASAVVQDYDETCGILVRHRDFYPFVYLPEDQLGTTLITDEYGALWTFEAELEMDPSVYQLWMYTPDVGGILTQTPATPDGWRDDAMQYSSPYGASSWHTRFTKGGR